MLENCCPNVAAFKLEAGKQMLLSCGFVIGTIRLTCPPGKARGQGDLRIVRQMLTEEGAVDLLVSYESYVKEVN